MRTLMKGLIRYRLLVACLLGSMAANAQQLPKVASTSFRKDTLRITNYGAVAGGVELNTKAINAAIAACSKRGGGVVVIPEGLWATGPIVLQSNVNLHLQRNALLQFTADFDQYPLIKANWEGVEQMRNQSPISADNATNIAITGYGIIDGNGDAWRMVKKDKLTSSQWKRLVAGGGVLSIDEKTWYPTGKSRKGAQEKNPGFIQPDRNAEYYNSVKDFLRPNLLVFTGCKRILLEGITFQNSPAWCLHPLMCEDVTIRNIYVKNPWYAQNGDGIDLESCSRVQLDNSTFDVGDDGICIKSGRDEAGRKRGMPSQYIYINNCTVYHAHGGFVVGSEMSGGAKHIYVNNCTFIGTDIGLRFKTTRGRGGIVEHIYVNNVNMKDIVGEAILFDMYYAAVDPIPLTGEKREKPTVVTYPVTEATPQFQHFDIQNVVCDGAAKAIFVRGLPEMSIKDIRIKNTIIKANAGIDITAAENIDISNINLIIPAGNPVSHIVDSKNVKIERLQYPANVPALVKVSGALTKGIQLVKTDASKAQQVVIFEEGATTASFTQQ
ncbi:polygalacturonase [Chitinophaga skermanii]|uniref:Polygalacturonase n=2 Tax=Chitinophaga skermanii TaxID=331697 RepID=A0A327QLA1_9BACT|nr:polygalacturonase [Chitinophaga skermanii]